VRGVTTRPVSGALLAWWVPSVLAPGTQVREPGPGQIRWNDQDLPQRLKTMKDQGDTGRGDRTAHLMLTEQSGAKRKVPQPSIGAAMIEAEQAMRRPGCRLRAIKVVRRHTAVARWKAGKQGWHRVA
jgi:hypothetical protein